MTGYNGYSPEERIMFLSLPQNEGTFGIINDDNPIRPLLQHPRCLCPGYRLQLRGAERHQRYRWMDLFHRLVRLFLPPNLRELEEEEVSESRHVLPPHEHRIKFAFLLKRDWPEFRLPVSEHRRVRIVQRVQRRPLLDPRRPG